MNRKSILVMLIGLSFLVPPSFADDLFEIKGRWPFGSAKVVTGDSARGLVFLGAGGAVVALDHALNEISTFTFPRLVEQLSLDANRLYAADKAGFSIIDTQNPAAMASLGSYSGRMDAMTAAGGMVYVLDGATLRILNETQLPAVSVIGALDLPANPERISDSSKRLVFADQRLYGMVADSLFIVDVTDPSHPALSSSYETGGEAKTLCVDGNHAYIGVNQDLVIMDVSNPLQPAMLFRHPVGSGHLINIKSSVFSGDHVYLTDIFQGLWVVDVTDSQNPRDVGAFGVGNAWDVYNDGSRVYLTVLNAGLYALDATDPSFGTHTLEETWDISMGNGIAAVLMNQLQNRVDLMRVSKTAPPQVLSSLSIDGSRIELSTNRLCVVYYNDPISFFDIHNPAEPVQTADYYDETLSEIMTDITLTDTLMAYATQNSGIILVDLSDATQPTRVGEIQGTARALHIHDKTLYVLRDQDLVLIDVTSPAQPQQLSWIHLGENSYGFAIYGDRVCAYSDTALQIIDVSNPAQPTILGSLRPGFTISGLQIEGSMIYASGFDRNFSKIAVFDASNPTDIHSAGELIIASPNIRFRIEDGKAYIASFQMGLQILDLSDPQNLRMIQPYATPSMMVDIDYADQRIYSIYDSGLDGSWMRGFNVYTVSSSTNIEKKGYCDFDWGHECYAIRAAGNFAYGKSDKSLEIFDVSDPSRPMHLTSLDYGIKGASDTLLIADGRLYVKPFESTVDILDISNPAAPAYLESIADIDFFTIHEDKAAAAFQDIQDPSRTEIKIYDLAHPQTPVAGSLTGIDKIGAIAYDGRHVYLITHKLENENTSYIFRVLDVNQPTSPSEIGACTLTSMQLSFVKPDIRLSGNQAFITGDANGLRVIDLSSPAQPLEKTIYDTPGDCYKMDVADNYIYVADGSGGITILGEKTTTPATTPDDASANNDNSCFISILQR